MGVLSTYAELKTGITDYSGRSSTTFTANLPTFIMRAHTALMRELTIPLLQATADITINAERVAVPTGFRAVERFATDSTYDTPMSPTSIENRLRESTMYSSGRPRLFTIEGGYFAFGPVPDATYVGKLLYRKAITFFASDSATNDLLTKHPFAYFYGALAEAARFDKFDEDEAKFEALFRDEITAIELAERRDATSGGVLAVRPSGIAV